VRPAWCHESGIWNASGNVLPNVVMPELGR
jgi:hypothetical protein